MANDEMTTLSVAETDNDPQKNAQALERLLQSMFDASNPKSRSKPSRYSSENDVLIEKSVKYTDFFLLSIVYV